MLRGKRLPDQWVAGPWRSHQRRAGVHAVCCPAWSVTTKPKFYPQVNRLSEKVCKTNRAGHATTKTWPCFQANNSSLLHYVDTEAFTFVVAVFLMPLKLYYVVALLLPGIAKLKIVACPALPTTFISSWGETEGLSYQFSLHNSLVFEIQYWADTALREHRGNKYDFQKRGSGIIFKVK